MNLRAKLVRCAFFLFLTTSTTVNASNSGFFGSDRDTCKNASGTLQICTGDDCIHQNYLNGNPDGIATRVPSPSTEGLISCVGYEPLLDALDITQGTDALLDRAMPTILPGFRAKDLTSLIPTTFEAPSNWARIEDVMPVTLDDPEYPALLVFWVDGKLGGDALPLQILKFDHASKTYVDGTAGSFAGKVPLLDFPRNATIAQLNGRTIVFVSNHGVDKEPWSCAVNTLLITDESGKFLDRSNQLSQDVNFNHFVSSGIVTDRGDLGFYVNNMNRPDYYVMRQNWNIDLKNKFLPKSIRREQPKFTSSAMADINGDGLDDIILGSNDQSQSPSIALINNGRGDFSRAKPISLPLSPIPNTKDNRGAIVVAVSAINISGDDYTDLIITSTSAIYRNYSVQILVNDGKGNFSDETAQLIRADSSVYFQEHGVDHSWTKRARTFEWEGKTDILTQSALVGDVPSYLLRDNGSGTFEVTAALIGRSIAGAASFGGEPMLITVKNTKILLTEYPKIGSIRIEATN